VFGGLPVASVWTRAEPVSSARFIQDPDEASFNTAEWLRWAPGEPGFVSSLRAILGRRTYLLKLTAATTWQVSGQPALRSARWIPDAYNLRSFPVDPQFPPTFQQFFQSSAAHYDRTQNRLHGVYRLGTEGKWIAAGRNDTMVAGEAYWVYCLGESSFAGPLGLALDTGDRLDFGQELERVNLQFANRGDATRTVTLRQVGAVTPGVLAYSRWNATTGSEWVDLPNAFVFEVIPGASQRVQLAIRRTRMPAPEYATVLEITDGQGTRYRIPVTAAKLAAAMPYAGLWAGQVTVNAVSEPHLGSLATNTYVLLDGQAAPLTDPRVLVTTNQVVMTNAASTRVTNELIVVKTAAGEHVPVYEKVERSRAAPSPTPTRSEFTMRLLVHVDAAGQARLLKEVVQLWREGTYTNDASGRRVVDRSGEYVLVTRDDLLSQFKGSIVRDGVSVGRRLSAIGFDFDAHGTNHLELTGSFGPSGSLSGEIHLSPDYPLNPFRHRYHPDHDDLNPFFEPITRAEDKEAYDVRRQIKLVFTADPKGSASTADPGYAVVEGTYHEDLIGLHQQTLSVRGTFRLSRASLIAELNPAPTP
jgi:hypothetical protein